VDEFVVKEHNGEYQGRRGNEPDSKFCCHNFHQVIVLWFDNSTVLG
jgi:hypothetical protein